MLVLDHLLFPIPSKILPPVILPHHGKYVVLEMYSVQKWMPVKVMLSLEGEFFGIVLCML